MHYLNFDLDLGVNIIQNVVQHTLLHMIYAPAMFGVATSEDLGGDAFTRKYII